MTPIIFEQRDGVALLTLNRPGKYNAFNREMALLLQQMLDECRQPAIRCVYITGSGRAFCAGQDLEEITGLQAPKIESIVGEHYNPIITRIRNLEKPVVAAVNGVAAGAGANIALACDVVVAAESASFVQAFSKIGLVPDSGGTFFLPRLVGWQKAAALMLLGNKVSAAEAGRLGMIYTFFSDEQFANESLKIATTLAAMPTTGLALTKQLLNRSFGSSLEEQLRHEESCQQQAGATNDFREGVQAFLEKRPPNFTGT